MSEYHLLDVMKKVILSLSFALSLLIVLSVPAFAQRNVTPAFDKDPLLEADAKHNLDVARQAFLLKKAYKGVIMRFEETYAAYPSFSKMEEFLYLAGMSSYYLSRNEGKQKVNLKSEKEKDKFAPAKLREDAAAYLALMIEKNPESKYKDDAEKVLTELQAVK